MYNRYLNKAQTESTAASSHAPQHDSPPVASHSDAQRNTQKAGGILSGMGSALSDRLSNLHFDLDTIIVIGAIYFLLADSEDFDIELMVIIGVMLILGF